MTEILMVKIMSGITHHSYGPMLNKVQATFTVTDTNWCSET